MRWDNLFDDLESQLAQELTAEEIDLQAEEERLRLARLGIRDRLFALHEIASGTTERMLRLILRDGSRIAVTLSTFGRDWFAGELVDDSGRRPSCVVPIDAIDGIVLAQGQVTTSLDAERGQESQSALSGRLGLPFVLRDLCRRRQPVELHVLDLANAHAPLHGTIDRVGRDHLDLAVHERGRPRRESAVTEYRIVRLAQLLLVRF
ncbi:MAG: hypothetical protein JWR36_968 [Glaciihabitans sp.]|jgi:hypothetical protein|nr:hypothetical protein [Glaciihabitans sp.]